MYSVLGGGQWGIWVYHRSGITAWTCQFYTGSPADNWLYYSTIRQVKAYQEEKEAKDKELKDNLDQIDTEKNGNVNILTVELSWIYKLWVFC